MKTVSWDKYFMSFCNLISMKSKDESTNFGAVIVNHDNQIISTGYNSFPKGINDNVKERQKRPEKYEWFVHAEENAICNAAAIGNSTKFNKIYVNGMPCARCTRKILQAGIVEIIVDKKSNDLFMKNSPGDWKKLNRITLEMIGEVPSLTLRFWNGKTIKKIERLIAGEMIW